MKRLSILQSFLLLLSGMSVAACFEAVDLSSPEDPLVPGVYCILAPADTQYLELKYISRAGVSLDEKGINGAEVTLEEFTENKDGQLRPVRRATFQPSGDGRYQLVRPGIQNRIQPGIRCRLQVCLPSGDTLRAETTMPDVAAVEQYFPIEKEPRNHRVELPGVPGFTFEFTSVPFDGWVPGDFSQVPGPHHFYRSDKAGFVIQSFDGAVYVSKVGWSKEDRSWFTEDYLTCNREELADAFNRTGGLFTHSEDPSALSVFPDMAGKPLHYRYLRFPGRASQDTLFFSGDFKGPHYGDANLDILALARSWETWVDAACLVEGLPYEPSMIRTGEAGYLRFAFVSEEYDRYLKDLLLYDLLHNVSTDIVGIYDNTNLYSNIEGGVGIFGAKNETQYYWTCGNWQF